MIKLNNKAAMFGLDARITLAIFGALSIISGAVLFSSINESKATAYLTQMTEVGKAWEQYYIDTGFPVMRNHPTSRSDVLKIEALVVDPGLSGWKGPYLDTDYYNSATYGEYSLGIPKISTITSYAALRFQNNSLNWDDGHHYYRYCKVGTVCSVWVVFSGFTDDVIFNEMDEIVDESDGHFAGSVRKKDNDIHLKFIDQPNPLE